MSKMGEPQGYAAKRAKPRKHQIVRKPVVSKDNMKTAQYLTAHSQSKVRGYHVRIGKLISLFFGSNTYGSDDKAFDMAIRYRDEMLELLDQIEQTYRGNVILSRRNKSGYIGINLSVDKGEGYIAQWKDENGNKHQKWFGIAKYGKEEALRLAIQTREEAVGPFPHDLLKQIKLVTERYRLQRDGIGDVILL